MNPCLRLKAVFIPALLLSSGGVALGAQCYSPSDPLRLDDKQSKAVVLTIKNNPDVFSGADFSLKRSLKNILSSFNSPPDDANVEALLDSMLTSFKTTKLTNEESGLSFPVVVRDAERNLTAKDLLAEGGKHELKPVGLFNRLDLAPADFSTCGEFRIVYAKHSENPLDRFTLILEAALPNPDAAGTPLSCQGVYQLWKSFEGTADKDIASQVEKFYFTGGALGTATFSPVVHYQHYGPLGPGQIRANAFVNGTAAPVAWHLLEWKIAVDTNNPAAPPVMKASGVGENPAPAFFGESSPGGVQPPAVFEKLRGAFQNTFLRRNVDELTNLDVVAAIPLDPPSTVQDLIDSIGVDIEDRFYAMESTAAGSDDVARIASGTALEDAIKDRLEKEKLDRACGLTAQHVLKRMGAMTCGGCHQFSNAVEIAPNILWPRSLNFVHIDEKGEISDLLRDRFLPFRYRLLQASVSAPVATVAKANDPAAIASAATRLTLQSMLSSVRQTKAAAPMELSTINQLSNNARSFDKNQFGAFVRFRKPD